MSNLPHKKNPAGEGGALRRQFDYSGNRAFSRYASIAGRMQAHRKAADARNALTLPQHVRPGAGYQAPRARARRWEIDENLCRADLTEMERGEHLAKRKEIYEWWRPETRAATGRELAQKRWGDADDNLSPASFTEDTAKKTGIDQRTIQRSIRRVAKIDERVRDRIRDNPEIADSGDRRSEDFKRQNSPFETFATDTAAKTGIAERTIRQSIRRVAKIAALTGRGQK